jgi:L-rhamnose mutarotase
MQRFASLIALRLEKQEEYLELHREVWPSVLDTLQQQLTLHASGHSDPAVTAGRAPSLLARDPQRRSLPPS